MKLTVLDKATVGEDLDISPLRAFGELVVYDETKPWQIGERIRDSHVVLINKVRLGEEQLKDAQNLRLICVFATGFDNIDVSYAREHGIAVCNVPAYSTESVTLLTVSTALALCTHLREYAHFVASGDYTREGNPNRLTPVFHEIAGKTWGIVGAGHIGTRVGEIAEALGARVIVHQRHAHPRFPTVDMDTLCRESDILSLHCPLNDATRHIVDARRLSLMKPTAILVNEARGAVTDEQAVAQAIEEGRLGAFGADVYSKEPFGTDHPFYRIMSRDNVLLTPHTAWGAFEARERCLTVVCSNIEDFLAGGRQNRVD